MNYFKILALFYGFAAFLKPFYMHLLPWDENKFLEKFYAKERSKWIIFAIFVGTLAVGFTWYKHFASEIEHSIIITILFSLTLIKGAVLAFDYEKFHTWVYNMLKKDKGKDIVIIDIFVCVFGLIILYLAFFVY